MKMMETYLMKLLLFINDVHLMYLQSSSNEIMKGIKVCARIMMEKVCHKAYAVLSRRSRVCTRKSTCKVTYALLRSKSLKPGEFTMVLTHCFERLIIYLILSRNTIGVVWF